MFYDPWQSKIMQDLWTLSFKIPTAYPFYILHSQVKILFRHSFIPSHAISITLAMVLEMQVCIHLTIFVDCKNSFAVSVN